MSCITCFLSIALAAISPQQAAPEKLVAFSLQDVRLLDGVCKTAQDRNRDYLLSLNPDRLLRSFRINAGLPAPGEPFGGWEAPGIEVRGHFFGHYLSSCALMYVSTGDERLKERGTLIVAELAKCQEKLGDGYLSAFPTSFWDRLESGTSPWAPYYTIHKIMAGLYDQYTLCDNTQALDILKGMGDYYVKRVAKFTHEEWNAVLDRTEEGGIDEAFWNLFAVTGDARYRALAEKFEKSTFLEPLARGVDNLTRRHGNTHIPLVIGAMRRYEILNEPRYKYLGEFFWDRVVRARSFATGGSTNAEIWGEPYHLATELSRSNHESCKTYNMLRLTRHLMRATADPQYADFYERAYFNGILGTQEPESGMLSYYTPMITGYQRVFGTPESAFWCCTGTGVESHAKLGDSIYFHDADGLYVHLFVPSRLTWKEKGMVVEQQTKFPDEATTTLVFQPEKPTEFTLNLRVPYWAGPDFTVTVNGTPITDPMCPGSYLRIKRTWQKDDRVAVIMPMRLHTWPMPDDPNLVAILYGPLVLAGITNDGPLKPVIATEPVNPQPEAEQALKAYYFLAETPNDLSWLQPVEGQPLTFRTLNQPFTLTFKPINRVSSDRYGVYWPIVPKGSERQLQFDRQNAALDLIREANAVPKDGKADAVRAHYDTLVADKDLVLNKEAMTLAVARALARVGKQDDAKTLVLPMTTPFIDRQFAKEILEVTGPLMQDWTKTQPLVIVPDAGDGACLRTEKDGRPCVTSQATKGKPYIYFSLPGDSVLLGLEDTVDMTIDCYTDGTPGRKILVEYDGKAGAYVAATVDLGSPNLPAGKGWQQVTLRCADVLFSGRQNLSADFRISTPGSDVFLGKVVLGANPEVLKNAVAAFEPDKEREIDFVIPGSDDSEKAHGLKAQESITGSHRGHSWRHASGWWSWDLKVEPEHPTSLVCVYWGTDTGRTFDILVNDTVIATQELTNQKPGKFFRVETAIPETLTKDRKTITVTFRSKTGFAGGVFRCATWKR